MKGYVQGKIPQTGIIIYSYTLDIMRRGGGREGGGRQADRHADGRTYTQIGWHRKKERDRDIM